MPDQFGNPTREELRAAGGGAGLSFNQLVGFGLTPLEAATRTLGFTGTFGVDPATGTSGAARDFRAQNLTGSQLAALDAGDFGRAILLGAGQGQGLDFSGLTAGGLTEREALTRLAGFEGTFGGGRAGAFRESLTGFNDALAGGLSPDDALVQLLGFQGDFGDQQAVNSFRQTLGTQNALTGSGTNTATLPITDVVADQVLNPQLAEGTEFVPSLIQEQAGEQLTGGQQLAPTAGVTTTGNVTAPTISGATGTAAQASQADALAALSPTAPQATSTFTTPVTPATAQTVSVPPEGTVAGQLSQLLDFDLASGDVPAPFRGAISKANEQLAARGLSASTIAAGAITQAIIDKALPIAAQDASTYFQAEMANFNARQQTELANFQARQQNMLTDTAIANATEQFNASNLTQVEQFTSSLIANIQNQNANRIQAMEQFNVGEANKIAAQNAGNLIQVEQFNRQLDNQIQQFNSTLNHEREKFNSTMQFAVDQSNVLWRRSINTANTAAINAANQTNVQNLYNMSAVAQNNLWQQFRDEASWAFVSAESDLDRLFNSTMSATNREFNADLAAGQGTAEIIFKFLDFLSD